MKFDHKNYNVCYWEPYFGSPLVLERHPFKTFSDAVKAAIKLARKKKLSKWQRIRQVDIEGPRNKRGGCKIYHLTQKDF